MRRLLSFLTVLVIGLLIGQLQTPAVQASQDGYFYFDMSQSLNIDEKRTQIAIPDIILRAEQDIPAGTECAIVIPVSIRAIFSSNLQQFVLSGATSKISAVSFDSFSADQRVIRFNTVDPLLDGEEVYFSGLQLKIYQENNNAQEIQLRYTLPEGSETTLSSSSTIRLDDSGIRRRFTAPEPVRDLKIEPDGGGMKLSWMKSPDLDAAGYLIKIRPVLGVQDVHAEFVDAGITTHIVPGLVNGVEYQLIFDVRSTAGLISEKTINFTASNQLIGDESDLPVEDRQLSAFAGLVNDAESFQRIFNELDRTNRIDGIFHGDDPLTRHDFYELARTSPLGDELRRIGVRRLDLYLKRAAGEAGETYLTNDELLMVINFLARRERLKTVNRVRRFSSRGISTRQERRFQTYRYMLHRKGLIDPELEFVRKDNPARQEEVYILLHRLLEKVRERNSR